ncbi:hypothetical protein HQQ81_18075 [Microbacteriaceae bacterium VKM Ac-2854]|nr:hypothetical protein [Microbacteriaceae bacterium VKM Ac-2854]
MAIAYESVRSAGRYWSVPLARAVVALAVGIVVTFSADHTPSFGLAVFGAFALVAGVIGAILHTARVAGRARALLLTSASVDVLAGVIAILLLLTAPSLDGFVYLVAVWGVFSGVPEFLAGRAARTDAPLAAASRDWRLVGAATALFGVVFAVLPPHPIVSVGLLGAYAVMLGVFLGIAAFSLKWAAAGAGSPIQKPNDGELR